MTNRPSCHECRGETLPGPVAFGVEETPDLVGQCRITLDGSDVTDDAMRGGDGWVLLTWRDGTSYRACEARVTCGRVADRLLRGVVQVTRRAA